MKKQSYRGFSFYIILILIVVLVWYFLSSGQNRVPTGTYDQFKQDLQDNRVVSAEISQNEQVPTGNVSVVLSDRSGYRVYVSDVKEIETQLEDAGISYVMNDVPKESWLMTLLPLLLVFGAMFILFMIISGQSQGGGANSRMMNFGKSRARMTLDENKNVNFTNVAGLKEEKEELEEIVDFLSDPGKYTALGARIPKGVLLVGPPGTGKTLLARAIAGEAGVPFFSISGSDFVEMFVGVGASRVRDLFEDAKKNAPCIVFIDEIDAVARRRGAGLGGGHDEREQTLNQLLVEMDGFGINEGIIVMAATNRVDILDPAIMRPGRFDRKIGVGRPDIGGREEILAVHAKNKPLGDDVDMKQIAQTTAGFTGADLENLLNEAAIVAARENRKYIRQDDIRRSFVKVGIGAEKKSRVISEKEKRITAYHESGHAILFHLLPDVGPVYSVSIIPTGLGAAGYTMPLPERDEMFNFRGKMLQEITVDLGGRVAESLIFGDVTTGASQDIKQATHLAKSMVTKYGMSDEIGLINYDNEEDEVFIGRDLAHTRGYGEDVARKIDEEVKRIIDECYQKATEILNENREILDRCAALLMEKEKITREEFETLFPDSGEETDPEEIELNGMRIAPDESFE
ncbi:MAG: ATP-dependent zinc metalloprotease FtsH [Lachnospiraceae bacterium]|nr:ATP-dependent zinc metalloprotease FtsH [Lachnospiraceae bacterium]